MLIALIKVRTVNLTEIACGFSRAAATQDSRYIRIKHFFREFQIDFAVIAAWVIHFFACDASSHGSSRKRCRYLTALFTVILLLIKMYDASDSKSRFFFAALLGICLLVGLSFKFTFMSTILATLILLIKLFR